MKQPVKARQSMQNACLKLVIHKLTMLPLLLRFPVLVCMQKGSALAERAPQF